MEHCVGKVINLKQPPQMEQTNVDIPAFTQNPIDDEVLVNIEKDEVKDFNMDRYQRFERLPDDLKVILKRNAVSINDQLDLIPILRKMMLDSEQKSDIIWSSVRDKKLYQHLYVLFNLVKDRFVEGNEKNVLLSVGWMASQTTSYLYNKDIRQLVDDRLVYLAKSFMKKEDPGFDENAFSLRHFIRDYPQRARTFSDDAIETVFKFQKNWLQYKIPKWLNVIDSLQKYVAKELGVQAGDYSFVAEAIENEFADANIRILTEYGIPSSAIKKILDQYGQHLKDLTEDQVLAAIIRNKSLINRCLTTYEIESLDSCL